MKADAGDRQHAPATLRNREVILEVLRQVLPKTGVVLEVASGSGEHAAYFSSQLPELTWQPSDADHPALASIEAWGRSEGGAGWRSPLHLDVTRSPWPIETADAVVAINMLHISPWDCCEGLLEGASTLLEPGAPLYLYGPFIVADTPTAMSNVSFDQTLRRRDPRWGIRELEAVCDAASARGFELERRIPMPANNLSVIFRRRSGSASV